MYPPFVGVAHFPAFSLALRFPTILVNSSFSRAKYTGTFPQTKNITILCQMGKLTLFSGKFPVRIFFEPVSIDCIPQKNFELYFHSFYSISTLINHFLFMFLNVFPALYLKRTEISFWMSNASISLTLSHVSASSSSSDSSFDLLLILNDDGSNNRNPAIERFPCRTSAEQGEKLGSLGKVYSCKVL